MAANFKYSKSEKLMEVILFYLPIVEGRDQIENTS